MEIVIATSNPYSDCPPETRYLQEQINEYLAQGYILYGNPYMDTKGGNYPATFQMMIREELPAPETQKEKNIRFSKMADQLARSPSRIAWINTPTNTDGE